MHGAPQVDPIAKIGCGPYAKPIYGQPIKLPRASRMSYAEYASHESRREWQTADQLALFSRNPRLWQQVQVGISDEPRPCAPSPAATLILEGRAEFENIVSTSRHGREYLACCEMCRVAVEEHEHAMPLLQDGRPNLVVRRTIRGVKCQGWADYIGPRGIVALEVVDCLSLLEEPAAHAPILARLALIRLMLRIDGGERLPARIIGVEIDGAHRCGVWHVTNNHIDRFEQRAFDSAEMVRQSKMDGHFPTLYERVRTIGGAA